MPKVSEWDRYVHKWGDRWVVATAMYGGYLAHLRPSIRKETGQAMVFGGLDAIAPDCYHYQQRHDALKRAKQLYGEEI